MKTVKRIVAVLLAVMLMAPAAVNAAAPSVTKTSIKNEKTNATVTYNKKKQTPTTVTINGKKLVVGKDCVIVGKKKKNAGKYILTVKGIGNYSGETKVVFTIKNSVLDLKESDIEHIFERFYTVDKSRNRSGSGLGLYIVRLLLNKIGGEVKSITLEDSILSISIIFKSVIQLD